MVHPTYHCCIPWISAANLQPAFAMSLISCFLITFMATSLVAVISPANSTYQHTSMVAPTILDISHIESTPLLWQYVPWHLPMQGYCSDLSHRHGFKFWFHCVLCLPRFEHFCIFTTWFPSPTSSTAPLPKSCYGDNLKPKLAPCYKNIALLHAIHFQHSSPICCSIASTLLRIPSHYPDSLKSLKSWWHHRITGSSSNELVIIPTMQHFMLLESPRFSCCTFTPMCTSTLVANSSCSLTVSHNLT